MSIKCLCGCKIEIKNLTEHLKSDNHDKKIFKKRAPTLDRIRELMTSIDNLNEKMSEGDYLKRCNRLKDLYEYWNQEHQFKRNWNYFIVNDKVYVHYNDNIGKFHMFDLKIKYD